MQTAQVAATQSAAAAMIPTLLQHAAQHYHAGRLAQAEALCQQVLQASPQHADALQTLAAIANSVGKNDMAVQLLRQALAAAPANAAMHNNLGRILIAQAQWPAAEECFRRALHIGPQNIDALTNLGAVLLTQSRLDEAAECYQQALALQPNLAYAHCNLGSIFQAQSQFEKAAESYRHALRLKPDYIEAHSNLGLLWHGQGKWGEAEACYRQALAIKPDYVDAHSNLGGALLAQERVDEALACYRHAINLNPEHEGSHINLGTALQNIGRSEEAKASFRQALAFNPDFADAYNNLGNIHYSLGEFAESLACFEQAIRCNPQFAEAYGNMGSTLRAQQKVEEAMECYHKALAINPRLASVHTNLGAALQYQDKLDEALVCFNHALALQPDLSPAYVNMGTVYLVQGRLPEALAAYRRSLAIQPNAIAHSNALMTMQYMAECSAADIFAEHLKFADNFEAPLKAQWQPHPNPRNPHKRLKVAYVSGDFRVHVVASFIEPILAAHDKTCVEVFAYYSNGVHDSMTDHFAGLVDHFASCRGMSEQELAERIRADGIDILVDLSGHTGGHRLLAFARKPAPIQVTWIGYPGTTGLSAMDYRLTDANLDPEGITDAFHTEALVRLPSSATFIPDPDSPPVSALPALSGAPFTFACLNNLAKVNQASVRMWARILTALPSAKLMLGNANDASTAQRLLALFAQEGIAAERLILQAKLPLREFLALHHTIDVLLDPYPYGGGTTSCHALWMGVPVITLAGSTTASRHGAALLNGIGLPEFVTHTEDDYVARAITLSQDLAGLNTLRLSMRERIAAHTERSPERLTRSLEAAYRTMWLKWCEPAEERTP